MSFEEGYRCIYIKPNLVVFSTIINLEDYLRAIYFDEFLGDDYLYCQRRPGFNSVSQLPEPIKEWVQDKYPYTHWFRTDAIQGYPDTMVWWIKSG